MLDAGYWLQVAGLPAIADERSEEAKAGYRYPILTISTSIYPADNFQI